MKHLITFLTVLLLAGTVNAETEYYTWVDENGVTNYAERSPQGINATYIGPNRRQAQADGNPADGRPGRRPGAVAEPEPAQAETNAAADSSAEAEEEINPDELIAAEREEIAAQIQQAKSQNCEMGKKNLAQLTAYSRIRVQENGQERFLSEQERQAKIQEARDIVRNNCQS